MIAQEPEAKAFSTLQAVAALRGITVERIADDREQPCYVATRGPLTREFRSLHTLHAWLEELAEAPA